MGFEVRRVRSPQGPLGPVIRLIEKEAISVLLDVGANAGQFAQDLRHMGYKGRIVSFEPVAEAHLELRKTAAGDPGWTVAPRMALGAEDGEVTVQVAVLSGLSSVLPPTLFHLQTYAPSATVATDLVPCRRLDSVTDQYLHPGEKALLKVDVQGFEKQVLEGAESLLEILSGVYIELSLETLYDGQALARDVLDYLERRGFQMWFVSPGWCDPQSGRMLQYDALLARSNVPTPLEKTELTLSCVQQSFSGVQAR